MHVMIILFYKNLFLGKIIEKKGKIHLKLLCIHRASLRSIKVGKTQKPKGSFTERILCIKFIVEYGYCTIN